jgi:hypothetical protein
MNNVRVLVVRPTLLQCLHHKVHSKILPRRSRYRERSKHVLLVANKRYDKLVLKALLIYRRISLISGFRSNVLWITITENRHVDAV